MPTSARIFATVLSLAIFTGRADACLRDTLDIRAMQWSDRIVRAKLVEPGKVTAIDRTTPAATSPTTETSLPPGAAAPEGFVLSTFEVVENLDGASPAGEQIRVLRLVSPSARPASCTASLGGRHAGDSFILLLRRCNQTELAGAPAGAIPQDVRKDAFVVVHAVAAAEADAGAIADLKQMIQDVRSAEAGATDDTIQPQVDAVANAADQTEAEDAHKALLELGPKALPALRAKVDDATVNDTGRSRVRRMIEELAAPALGAEAP